MDAKGGKLAIAGWGVYCACSWTWCIGMFLPVLLLEKFGWPGFLAFLIPNAAGCAAFGFIVKSRKRSIEIVAKHRAAFDWFSIIAIAFHVFFAGFLAAYLLPEDFMPDTRPQLAAAAAGALGAAAILVSWLPRRFWPALAAVVYAASLAILLTGGVDRLAEIEWSGRLPAVNLMWLTPTLCFGFLLCPLMDLTFHRAMQETNRRSTFVVFAATFAVMPLVTCLYADAPSVGLMAAFIVHIGVQSVFTVAAHLRELLPQRDQESPSFGAGRMAIGAVLLMAILPPLVILIVDVDYELAEKTYVGWFVFYGLVFPAYVLLFATPGRPLTMDRASLIRFGAAMAIATPLYWIGFIEEHMWALAPPLLALLAMKAVRARRSGGKPLAS